MREPLFTRESRRSCVNGVPREPTTLDPPITTIGPAYLNLLPSTHGGVNRGPPAWLYRPTAAVVSARGIEAACSKVSESGTYTCTQYVGQQTRSLAYVQTLTLATKSASTRAYCWNVARSMCCRPSYNLQADRRHLASFQLPQKKP